MDFNRACVFSFAGFVFDPESAELAQNGVRIRLGKQSADILHVLVLNPGALVKRQTLHELLWPGGNLVANHEKIINNGISRLRYIFHDDPLAPTFIERVPKLGYRWIMPVERIERADRSERIDRAAPSSTTPPDSLAEPEQQNESLSLDAIHPPLEAPVVASPGKLSVWRSHGLGFAAAASVALIAIAAGILLSRSRTVAAPAAAPVASPQTVSIAVAPLDASGPGAAELAESFRLDLTDALAQLPQVQVRSAHSVNQLRLTDASLPAYSSKLGLDVILFGTFKRSPHGCDLQLELVRVRDSVHLATFRYSGSIDQLRNIRDQIERDTFAKLRLTGNGERPPAGGTSDPDAYQVYLEAQYQFSQQSAESLRLAVKQYNLAIERDRRFGQAYVGLAQTYLILFSHNLISPGEAFAKAGEAVSQAQRLGDSSAQVHSILGYIRFYRDWDLAGGIDEEQQAVRLEPHQPIYRQWLAVLLCDERRFPEALNEIALAEADDPYWPSLYVTDAYVSSNAQDTARMIGAARKLKELLPDSPNAYDTMANALWYSGHQIEGIAEWRRMALLEHDSERVAMEDRGLEAYRRDGVPGYAKVRLAEFSNSEEIKLHPNDFDPEEWYMAAGDTQRALEALRQRVDTHDPAFLEEATTPFFNGIRDSPEFIALLQKAGVASQLAAPKP